MSKQPQAGEIWRHYNGNWYRVLTIANAETKRPEQYPVTVVYQNVLNGSIWARPLSDWHRSMEHI